MGLRAEWITSHERFAALAEPWDALAARDGSPFSLHRWYSAWWEAFGEGARMMTLALWRGDELAAAMPMSAQARELRAFANSHTPSLRPLYADDIALRELADRAVEGAGRMLLPRLPADGPFHAALAGAAAGAGRLTLVEPDQTSPYVLTTGSWEDYRERMKRRWSSAERKARKMAREHDASFSIVEPPSDLDSQLSRGFEVEASGWKGEAGTAIVSTPQTERFYRSVARSYDESGELALSEIVLDGRCVAFDLCLLHRRRLYLLKTGFDEGFGSLSPGLVLRQQVVRRCFEMELETHELLGDDTEWKRRFSTGVRSHATVRVDRRTPAGLSRHAYRRMARPLLRTVYLKIAARRP